MIQIDHLLAVTEVITDQVTAEAAAPSRKEALSPEELKAGHEERAKVMLLLDSALAKTESIKTHFANTNNATNQPQTTAEFNYFEKQSLVSEVAEVAAANGPTTPTDPKAVASAINDGLTAKNPKSLHDQTMTLQQMAKAAEPILTTFDSILGECSSQAPAVINLVSQIKKGLENYNASLNTAPVVGFKGENIVYIQTKSNRVTSRSVTSDSWAVFDKIPLGFDASQGATHFFPYEGNLYVANGTKLWVRRCRPKGDPIFEKQACNNWPKMYYDTWEHLGDNALPADNLADIVPWATLSAENSPLKFKLVALTAVGELQVLGQESLSGSNTFSPMAYTVKGKSPADVPSWSRIAYNNDKFVGYDRDYNLWDIVPDFSNNTYNIENKYAMGQEDTFYEYTANDIGLVVAKKDGFLYKRISSTVDTLDAPQDGQETPVDKTKWIRWIALDGVSNIGVASPGIILNLLTLTSSLKTRYLETQATLWPVVNTIKTFAGTHRVFLDQVNKAAKDYSEADDQKKQKTAIKVGKKAIGHAKAWASILTKTVTNAQEPVASMAKQLNGVYKDLEQQIGLLNLKLTELKGILKEQEKALSAAKVGFWAGIGTLLLGVVGVIAGLATGNVWLIVGGGVLFVGGLIAASVSGSKMDKAAAAVAKTNADIALVETAIRELTAVTKQFGEIDKMYGILNMFWGRMLGDAMSIGTNDEALYKIIGEGLLMEDDASYEYAMEMTGKLEIGAQAYQDLVSAQGIKIPASDDDDEESDKEDGDAAVASLGGSGSATVDFQYFQPLSVQKFSIQASHAQYALAQGNDDDYEVFMGQALETQQASIASISDFQGRSDMWFDIDSLKATAGVFFTSTVQSDLNVLRTSAPQAVLEGIRAIGSLFQSRKNLTGSLEATIELAKLMSSWSTDPFDEDLEEHENQIEKYKKPALKFCRTARDTATIANNSFADVNHQTESHCNQIRKNIESLRDQQRGINYNIDNELRNIDVPFLIQLFRGTYEFVQSKVEEISSKYKAKNEAIQSIIDQLEASLISFAIYYG